MKSTRFHIPNYIFIIGAILLIVFYFVFDPVATRFMPQCMFYHVTGYQCMGCGSQRMLHALLHGDISGAFRANAVMFCLIPIVLFLIYTEITRKRHPDLYAGVHRPWIIITIAAILVIWLPVRNYFDL